MLLKASEDAATTEGFLRFEMGSTLTGVALYARKGYREAGGMIVPVGDGETIEVVKMKKEAGMGGRSWLAGERGSSTLCASRSIEYGVDDRMIESQAPESRTETLWLGSRL